MKKFFKKLNAREKMLLSIVLWTIAIILLLSGYSKLKETLSNVDLANAELESMEGTIARTPIIEERLKASLEKMDPEKSYDSANFQATIDSITREVQLDKTMDTVKTTSDELIATHSMRVTFNKTSMSKLVAFDQRIQELSPYIRITELEIRSNKSNPEQLDTKITLSAIEIKKNLKQ